MASPNQTVDQASESEDWICIDNLLLPFGITAPDVWDKPKEQPGLLSISLQLHSCFETAASADKLDDSTIHYGNLAKRIRASCTADQAVTHVFDSVGKVITDMARKNQSTFIVRRSVVTLSLPKATMSGDQALFTKQSEYTAQGEDCERLWRVSFQNVKIMTLIGVNSYERAQRQPLVADITLEVPESKQRPTPPIQQSFKVEQALVQIIQDTAFETLETLAHFTCEKLRGRLLDEHFPGALLRLKLGKPRAIAFADAPAVEVVRRIPRAKGDGAGGGSEGVADAEGRRDL